MKVHEVKAEILKSIALCVLIDVPGRALDTASLFEKYGNVPELDQITKRITWTYALAAWDDIFKDAAKCFALPKIIAKKLLRPLKQIFKKNNVSKKS